PPLHKGTYAYRIGLTWYGLVVDTGKPATREEGIVFSRTPDGHLVRARIYHRRKWEEAQLYRDTPAFAVGERVEVRGSREEGVVTRTTRTNGGFVYDVATSGQIRTYGEDALSRLAHRVEGPEQWVERPPVNVDEISLTLSLTKLTHPLTDVLYSYA